MQDSQRTTTQKKQKLVALALVGLLYSGSLAYFFQSLPTARLTSDFFPRWHASRMLLTAGRSIYDWANATEISAVTGWPYLEQLGYYYPAYLLIFSAPLSLLPYGLAHIIWTMFGLWCLWLGMVIFADLLLPTFSFNRLTVLLILVTISIPIFQHTLYAQFNTLGLLALALAYRALVHRRYFVAGLWAGGLLFKPQATILPLLVLVVWTALERERRYFWGGLALISVIFWGVAELLEPKWVISFLGTLGSYVPIASIVDRAWNPYQLVSLTLAALTLWLIVRLRAEAVTSTAFVGLLVWAININALIVPMFGMMHMAQMGISFIILLSGFSNRYPSATNGLWLGIISLLVAGLLAFVIPLALVGTTGLHIASTEVIYRITFPILMSFAALSLIFDIRAWLNVDTKQVAT